MDLMIQSTVLDTIDGGVVLAIKVEDLSVQAYIVISKIDINVVEKIIPQRIFENESQVHVAGLTKGIDVSEEIVQILENMEHGDVVAYLCEDAVVYGEALAALGIKH
jgi:hypothetical protein